MAVVVPEPTHSLCRLKHGASQLRVLQTIGRSAAGVQRGGDQSHAHLLQARISCNARGQHAVKCRCAPSTADQDTGIVVLGGDIGGTNCRLSLWKVLADGQSEVLLQQDYKTSLPSFETALEMFGSDARIDDHPPQVAAFAVAGTVQDQTCKLTNSEWLIDAKSVASQFGWRVHLLNDFEAIGYGVPALNADEVVKLHDGQEVAKAPIAILGPGTGLGEAQLMWDDARNAYRVWPSEGAHASFAPRGAKQMGLLSFAEEELGEWYSSPHCEIEHVACGFGLQRIYRFLKFEYEGVRMTEDDTPESAEISKAAADGDGIAKEAVNMFLCIIGAEAGHMALRCLARGGVYIAGGIIPKIRDMLPQSGLLEAYLNANSRFAKVIAKCPLYLVINPKVGLLGAREYALGMAGFSRQPGK